MAVVIASWWASVSYFGTSPPEHLSFYGKDGHCVPHEALGEHCFGDLAAIRYSLFDSPNAVEAVYPLTSRILSFPFVGIANLAGLQIGVLFLALVSLLGTLACVWKTITLDRNRVEYLLALSCAINLGLLSAIDRGNTAAIAAVFFVGGMIVDRDHGRTARLGPLLTAIAILNKPTYAVFLVTAGRRFATRVVLYVIVLFLAVYRLGFNGGVSSFGSWLKAASAWSSSVNLATSYPPNYTAQKSTTVVLLIIVLVGTWLAREVTTKALKTRMASLTNYCSTIECRYVIGLGLYFGVNRVIYAYNLHVAVLLGLFVVSSTRRARIDVRWRLNAPHALAAASLPIMYAPWRSTEQMTTQSSLHEIIFRFALMAILSSAFFKIVRNTHEN